MRSAERRESLLALALVAATGLALAACKRPQPGPSREPASEATADAVTGPSVAAPGSAFGVHRGGAIRGSGAGVRTLVGYASELGSDWLRVNLPWDIVETNEGRRDWSLPDTVVTNTSAAGVNLLLQIRGYSEVDLYGGHSERKLAAYEAFVRDLVRRYRGQVRFWQIENEVIYRRHWKYTREDYVAVLETAYRAIKDEDSSAVVLLAGFPLQTLDLDQPENQLSSDDRERMRRIKDVLERTTPYYDVLDVHLYYSPESIPSRIEFFRNEMESGGYYKPIWVGETGGPDPRYYTGELTPKLQQAEVVKRFTLAFASGAARVFWHTLRGSEREPGDGVWAAMPLVKGRRRMPAFYTYQLMVRKLNGFTSVTPVDVAEDVHAYRFSTPRGAVFVIWGDDQRSVPAPDGLDSVVITDVDGVVSTDDEGMITIGPSPMFVEADR